MTLLAPLLVVALLGQDAASEPYHWPLDLPRVLTSSFAEYRPGRFHMGIDLRTGPVGKDVYAADDGYVARVRCSPYGYGKAVYLRLQDGNTVVYGHLSDYMPPLREYVRRVQHRRERYTVDLYPEPDAFPVTRGQVIAKSGETGVGVPHLHYEIRDAAGAPISPRSIGLDWPDATRPVFRKALVVPGDADTVLNGDYLPVVLEVRKTAPGTYETEPIAGRGTVGFAVDLIDPANHGANRLGVHTVETLAGGDTLSRLVHDRVSYGHQNAGAVAYHPYFLKEGRFLVLWRWPGNRTDIYRHGTGSGWYRIGEDSTEVTIHATDFHGNRAALTIPLRHQPAGEPLEFAETASNGAGAVEYRTFGEHLVVTARFSAPEGETPQWVLEPATEAAPTFARIDASTFRAAWAPPEGVDEFTLRVNHPRIDAAPERVYVLRRGAAPRRIEAHGLQIDTRPDSAFGTLLTRIRTVDVGGTDALAPYGRAVEVWPTNAPIDGPLGVTLPLPRNAPNVERLLIYRRQDAKWRPQETVRDGAFLRAESGGLGEFAVMEDTKSPTIADVRPSPHSTVDTQRPVIRAAIDDRGSGVESYRVTCNGAWILVAYDPEARRIAWEQDEDIAVGRNDIVIQVTDTAGNVTVREWAFTVAGPINGAATP